MVWKSLEPKIGFKRRSLKELLLKTLVLTLVLLKLAGCYACGAPGPSDLSKKREKIGEYAGKNFLYFYMYIAPFIRILPIFMYNTCFFTNKIYVYVKNLLRVNVFIMSCCGFMICFPFISLLFI